MGGNKDSALKGAETKRKKYGQNYFSLLGAKGGLASKGRVLSAETKKRISESKKAANQRRKEE